MISKSNIQILIAVLLFSAVLTSSGVQIVEESPSFGAFFNSLMLASQPSHAMPPPPRRPGDFERYCYKKKNNADICPGEWYTFVIGMDTTDKKCCAKKGSVVDKGQFTQANGYWTE